MPSKTLLQPLRFVTWRHNAPFSSSTEENFLERFLLFSTWERFHCTTSKKALLWLRLALPFLKNAIRHPLRVSCSENGQLSLFFLAEMSAWIWWTGTRSSEPSTLMLQNQRVRSWRQQVMNRPWAKSAKLRMLILRKERACVFWGNQRTSGRHPPTGSRCQGEMSLGSWNGLGATNELPRIFKLSKKWCRRCTAWFCDKSLQPELFSEVQAASSDYTLKTKDYGI